MVDNRATYKTVSDNSASRIGEPFEVLVRRRKYLPNIAARFCTTELKILPMKRYLTKGLGWKSGRRQSVFVLMSQKELSLTAKTGGAIGIRCSRRTFLKKMW